VAALQNWGGGFLVAWNQGKLSSYPNSKPKPDYIFRREGFKVFIDARNRFAVPQLSPSAQILKDKAGRGVLGHLLRIHS
jgi:hypothetical protein